MTETCDLCRSAAVEPLYRAESTARGLTVYLCRDCGLVQSLPRIDRAPRRGVAVSGDADWGNLRYGKGFRTDACLSLLRQHADLGKPLRLLDVGSNRGAFARAFLAAAPFAHLTAVEPDERVAETCALLERTELVEERIEDTTFPDETFDIVHSCHTIEHLAAPRAMLAEHWRVLKPGGVLIVDAPNIAMIGADDILEEWFIDKHLYHFSDATLASLLDVSGFDIIDGPDPNDRQNLLFAAVKRAPREPQAARNPEEAEKSRTLLGAYVATRARNLAALGAMASELERLAPHGLALWGAGRLFDALVRHGGFDPKHLALLVDTHLKAHMAERHGVALSGADALGRVDPAFIVVMSRAFSDEIARAARLYAPRAEILLYADLLSRARNLRAA